MSRAGAVAMRALAQITELQAEIAEKGVREAAMQRYKIEEDARIENAKQAALNLAAQLGLPEAEPLVLDDFQTYAPPHQRVCIKVDGLVLNYSAAWKQGEYEQDEHLQIIVGRCRKCHMRPALIPVFKFSHLARPDLPDYADKTTDYVCSECKKRDAS